MSCGVAQWLLLHPDISGNFLLSSWANDVCYSRVEIALQIVAGGGTMDFLLYPDARIISRGGTHPQCHCCDAKGRFEKVQGWSRTSKVMGWSIRYSFGERRIFRLLRGTKAVSAKLQTYPSVGELRDSLCSMGTLRNPDPHESPAEQSSECT